jgi:hypothetical protein
MASGVFVMSRSFAQPTLPTPLLVTESGVRMAKADLRNSEIDPHYAQLGHCLSEVQHAFALTLKEFAAELGKNESQVRRQMEGRERPQIEAVFAVPRFQGPLVIALARLATGVDVDTVIHVRRTL